MKKRIVSTLAACLCLFSGNAQAEIKGKVDFGPAYVHVDVIRNGNTINDVNMYGGQSTATVVVWKGLALKPSVLAAWNGNRDHLYEVGGAIGWVIPVVDKFYVTPAVGYTHSWMNTFSVIPDLAGLLAFNSLPTTSLVKQNFESRSPYVSVDASYSPNDTWSFTAAFRYAWSRTETIVGKNLAGVAIPTVVTLPVTTTTESRGWNVAGLIDYWLNDHWSINAAGAYSNSRSHDRVNALRGYGCRVGAGYYF